VVDWCSGTSDAAASLEKVLLHSVAMKALDYKDMYLSYSLNLCKYKERD
jgi:hypothetical protein